jgi:hypothetical protein
MAITKITSPADYGRVNDTNRLTYKFSSDKYTEANFQFQFNIRAYNADGTYEDLGNYNIYPTSGGTVEFNPAEVYKNVLSYDFNASKTTLTEALNTAKLFQLFCYDFYGTPPSRKTNGNWYESTPPCYYNGCQQNIPYDYMALNAPLANKQWVISGGTGNYLTESNRFELDNDDYAFLYFLAPVAQRPAKIKFTIWFWTTYEYIPDSLALGGYINNTWNRNPSMAQSFTNTDSGGILIAPGSGVGNGIPTITALTSTVVYRTVSSDYAYSNSRAYYFPMGPNQLINYGEMATWQDRWAYYTVDLVTSGNVVLNGNPFTVIRKPKCGKYGKVQLFWLNPHGGFDTFVFDKKKEINYKIDRTTYKQRLPTTSYSTYDAGEKILNVAVTETLTLNSGPVTQLESQLIMQMIQSPVVYLISTYLYNDAYYPFGTPYIVTTDKVKYEQKINSKEIYYEVEMRPSNEKIIQRG